MDDLCGEYNGKERRKHCELVVTVNQKFNDFIDQTKEFRAGQQKAIADLSVSVISMREEIRELKKPYKVLIWVLTVATGAFLIEASQWVFNFLRTRFH